MFDLDLNGKVALVTGGSDGLGRAAAHRLALEGASVVICGRRADHAQQAAQEITAAVQASGSRGGVVGLRADVTQSDDCEALIAEIGHLHGGIDILINNAGNAHGLDSFEDANLDDWDAMIDINVKGLLYVSKAVIPQMIKRKTGHVIHLGSTAGKEVYPKGNVYCASKHAVDALNHAMRIDLNGKGIKVSAIHPGLVETEFSEVRFKGDKARAQQVYKGYNPLQPEDIAEIIVFVLSRPPHVNIADLMVMCLDQASSTIVNKTVE